MTTAETPQHKLTLKQERFVAHYLTTGNATQAYKNAGYTASTDLTARVEGSRLLAKPNVQLAIEHRKQLIAASSDESPEAVARELWKLARSGDTSASRVSALRTLADIYGLTAGSARELPDALNAMLDAVRLGIQAGSQQAAISERKVVEIAQPRTATTDSPDIV